MDVFLLLLLLLLLLFFYHCGKSYLGRKGDLFHLKLSGHTPPLKKVRAGVRAEAGKERC